MARLASLRDTPNTAREYETIYILRPNTPNDGVADVNTRVKNVIEGMGGKVLKVDNWGKRRLAYEVEKERKGIYLYWLYLAQPGVVEEAERNLRMLDNVIRYMTVKVDENIDVGARPSEIDETSYEKAAQTAADEEDMFLSRGAEEAAAAGDADAEPSAAAAPAESTPAESTPAETASETASEAPAPAASEDKE